MTLTDSALAQLSNILTEENNPNLKLRVFVQGGGCSGFQYGFSLDEEQNEDDFDWQKSGITVLVDSTSYQYLQGSTIDYRTNFGGGHFSIDNPNSKGTCGCGSSFAF